MPDIDMWAIDRKDEAMVYGTDLPPSAEHVWQSKNCDGVMIELMCIYDEDGLYCGSLESENMVLRPADVSRVEARVLGNGEYTADGEKEVREFIDLAREYQERHPDKSLVVGVWI